MILNLNFYGYKLEVKSTNKKIIEKLKKDFSWFLEKSENSPQLIRNQDTLKVSCSVGPIPQDKIPAATATKQSFNSVTYDEGDLRANDYFGKALCLYNRRENTAEVFSPDENKLHEVIYLFILSRVEKTLDLNGLHKIHAFGVKYDETTMICTMPMKGGKSTLLWGLMQAPDMELISDDTPLIRINGDILPFPVRIGLDKLPKTIPEKFKSTIERTQYGKKDLIDIMYFKNRLFKADSQPTKKLLLIEGLRHSKNEFRIKNISKILMIKTVVANLVIGIGLPMVLEHFLEKGFSDILNRFKIIFSRSLAAFNLLRKCECYQATMGQNIPGNRLEFLKFIENKNSER